MAKEITKKPFTFKDGTTVLVRPLMFDKFFCFLWSVGLLLRGINRYNDGRKEVSVYFTGRNGGVGAGVWC